MKNFYNLIYRHRYDIFFSLVLILLLGFICYVLPKNDTKSLINTLENKSFDFRQNIIAKNKKVRNDIVIVSVDDPSYEYLVEKYGDWPIPRSVHAELLEYIQAQKPKLVAFDYLFVKSLKRIPKSDEQLVNGFKKYQNTYTAINFDDFSSEVREPPILNSKLATEIEIESNNIHLIKYSNCRIIMDEIIEATKNIGHINSRKSDDGFLRTIPIIVGYPEYEPGTNKIKKENYYLYMSVKMAIDYLNKYENANITKLKIDKNNNIYLANRKLPLTDKGEIILNWYGDTGLNSDKTFKYISYWEVLKSAQQKQEHKKQVLSEDTFKDKIVIIGTNVFELSDVKAVPTSKYLPGAEIHATLINNILDNTLIHKASLPYNLFICFILAAAAIYTVFKIRSVYICVLLFIILNGFYLYFSTYIMDKYSVWVWIVIPWGFSVFVFICSFIIKYLIKSRDFEYTYKLATTDGLTELYNHRYFQEQMKINTKLNKTFSLIMIDIDFFKKFNDKYGHQAGDAVLKHVASTLKRCVRSQDIVCRYGGEEMTIILKETNKETAINIAKKICETVASKKYELTPELEVNVTISLGVSTYPDNGKTPQELIEYADKCLYAAKENGRNQVGFINIS